MGAPLPIELGSLGMADSLILMVLALVVFGPRRLPQIGRQIGKLMYEFRKASNDFKFQMEEELRLSEDADRRKKDEAERARDLALNPPAPVVEAQAAIGADDQASVSAPAGLYSSEAAALIAETPAEDAGTAESVSTTEESRIRYPRINPPATGEPVSAVRPGAVADSDAPAQTGVNAEANVGAEPAATAPDAAPPTEPPSQPTRTEPVNQHG